MKKQSSTQCIFCGKAAFTQDHIPTKSLLEKPYPPNLFTVPSCKNCNQSFSLDEEYFLNVLVEITTNPVLLAKKQINGNVYRARQRSPKLNQRIQNALVSGDDGIIYFNPEYERIEKVIEKNALGLYYKKYKLLARLDSFRCVGIYPFDVTEMRPAEVFMLVYGEKFKPKRWTTIQPGVFSYIVVRDWRRGNKLSMIFEIHHTIWAVIDIPAPNYRLKRQRRVFGQLELFNELL